MILNFKKVLAFFAHPDDETLAAGATINKMVRNGTRVYVAIPNTGVHGRRNTISADARDEALKVLRKDTVYALSLLGINDGDLFLGEFSDNEMDKHTLLELTNWLENIIQVVKPDAIFTHHRFCTNIDHQYCHEAAVLATRPSVNSHIPLFCGEVSSSTGYLRPAQWEPNFYVNVESEDVEAKIRAMEAYKIEARPDPHPRSPEVLRALAKVRGAEGGFFFGEAFMIQKIYS
ncbi:MAG: PIG-L family deacetylase [Ignavibacteriaceae bacterium]|nr:PIG-L family deacetylase [Ignavibacteriaceae bacterium]